MYLSNLHLESFRNYQSLAINCSKGINCFVGKNGSGKTNLLDAIHYLSMTKGSLNSVDSQNIRKGDPLFFIKGEWKAAKKGSGKGEQVQVAFQPGQKKLIKVNQKEYEKLADHIGRFPVVLIAPNDTDLIREGSDGRRKFFDSIISQLDASYLENLMVYHHYLKQRNSLLKQYGDTRRLDKTLLAVYDEHLMKSGQLIFDSRRDFTEKFEALFSPRYQWLSGGAEQTKVVYVSELSETSWKENFKKAIDKDMALQRTTFGIHRDDFEFLLEDEPVKKFGSQGQQKSFVIALKLAQFDITSQVKSFAPILLLDDIFDKLDDDRIKKLMELVGEDDFGQLFVTDARPERTMTLFKGLKKDKKLFKVEEGKVEEIDF
ncbi:MAG: DNA replication/repair protein RecF [Imperialibacter sp.]|uniref:DNA replication/repair protein RecF n=1 Tax=Imperialibacter sp. TaxID=2038411 RepID=UPI003A8BFF99